MTLQELLEDYAQLRTHLEAEELKLKPIKAALENLAAAVLGKLNEEDLDGAKTKGGHRVSVVQNRSTRVVDGDAFFGFIVESGNTALLQRRASTDAVLQYLDDHGGELPPGVEVTTVNTLRFTKSKEAKK